MLNIAGLDHRCRITAIKYAGYGIDVPDKGCRIFMEPAVKYAGYGINVPDEGCRKSL